MSLGILNTIKKAFGISREYMVSSVCLEHIGNVRDNNEDNYYFRHGYLPMQHNDFIKEKCWDFSTNQMEVLGLFDGMGGECAGELASYVSASEFAKLIQASPIDLSGLSTEEQITELLTKVNEAVCDAAKVENYKLIGSTTALMFFQGNKGMAVNVGDSPTYRFRDDKLELLSYAHTNASLLKDMGITRKPALTQFLGMDHEDYELEPYIAYTDLKDQDIYLLCSDGLTDMVSEETISEVLHDDVSVLDKGNALLELALENGGKDNITVILSMIRDV